MSNPVHEQQSSVPTDWIVQGVLHEGDRGIRASLLRALLLPLSWLHRIGLEVYLTPFRLGLRKQYRLPVPVISIGNLSSGGTGKTPATVLVAGYLRDRGRRVVVLSRGHRGSGESGSEPRIVSDGLRCLLTPDEAGDEPVLLASLLAGIPVIVCRDRRKSGKLAVEQFAPDAIVLDDGMQYWQLHRDLDIVLLDARRPFDNGHVLPRGLLREPPSHLARAGAVILTRADHVSDRTVRNERVRDVSRFVTAGVPVLTATHTPTGWVQPEHPDRLLPIAAFAGQKAIVFSGIADDAAFAQTVRSLGIEVTDVISFGDHHAYTDADILKIRDSCANDCVALTTEKDLVKVSNRGIDAGLSIVALRIEMQVQTPASLFAVLDNLVDKP